ncbi:hypothetical protein [Virgibacillus sp. LDC-1]|uniref:hypothetical protein n=1 Tax=Virgibacillus sp. LDC-1 TaxID=3039856 RepID=UPI0024DE39A4|nr:hypothetical protein [Virgibacillus sp. LDC-1]
MTLYINANDHPGVFKNEASIKPNNQDYFKTDYMSDMIGEQRRLNASFSQSFTMLQEMYKVQEQSFSNQWESITQKLQQLLEKQEKRENMETKTVQQLKALDEKQTALQGIVQAGEDEMARLQENIQTIIDAEKLLADHFQQMHASEEDIVARLKQLTSDDRVAKEKLNAVEELTIQLDRKVDSIQTQQTTMAEQMAGQQKEQQVIRTEMDEQLALLQKVGRQVEQMRSILYERANYLAEKVEEGYQLTSSYIYQLFTGADKPMSFVMKEKETKKVQQHN